MSSTIGTIFKVTTYGESHGNSVGVIIDGVPSGVHITKDFIQAEVNKRRATNSQASTSRLEQDLITIHSGVFNEYSTGTPIFINVTNTNFNSQHYDNLKDVYRPSHADYTYAKKYDVRDYRGGGRSSGRETVARVCAGAVAKCILQSLNIQVYAFTSAINTATLQSEVIDYNAIYSNDLKIPCQATYAKANEIITQAKSNNDSVGGIVTVHINNLKAGIGEPIFNKLDSALSYAIMSIGGVKGIEFGNGFSSTTLLGSTNNDSFYYNEGIHKYSNNSGGILGGISDGSQVTFNVAIKPTPSISQPQQTINTNNENVTINIQGRHDTCIVPRVLEVINAMTCITLVDLIFLNLSSNINSVINSYNNL